MSIFRDRGVTCPNCGHHETHKIAQSIHGPRVPKKVQAILERRFQVFQCGECPARFDVAHPLTYFDWGRQHWVAMYPSEFENRWPALDKNTLESFEGAMLEHAPSVMKAAAPEFIVRTVFGLDALGEKLWALREGLDDVALEVLKLDLLRQSPALSFNPAARPRLWDVRGDALRIRVWPIGNLEPMMVMLERGALDAVTGRTEWADARRMLSEGTYVDLGRVMIGAPLPAPSGAES